MHWLQYLHIGFSTYALASVLTHWLQYLHIGFTVLTHLCLPTIPTHLYLLTYAYTQCSYHAYAYPCRRHEKDLVTIINSLLPGTRARAQVHRD
jgi:hypothetical protein